MFLFPNRYFFLISFRILLAMAVPKMNKKDKNTYAIFVLCIIKYIFME